MNFSGKKAVAYVRVSTVKQVENGFSLESQKMRIERFCDEKKMKLIRIYNDDGISGKTMNNRAGLMKMLEEIEEDEVLVVMALSRIARNHDDASKLVKDLLAKGVHDIFEIETNTKVDVYSSTGKLNFQLKASIDEYSSSQMGDVISRTMIDMSSEGKLKGKPPFGWKNAGKGVKHVRNEAEQKIISRIMDIIKEYPTFSYSKLARILDGEGKKCRNAKKWNPSYLKKIIIAENERRGRKELKNELEERKQILSIIYQMIWG